MTGSSTGAPGLAENFDSLCRVATSPAGPLPETDRELGLETGVERKARADRIEKCCRTCGDRHAGHDDLRPNKAAEGRES